MRPLPELQPIVDQWLDDWRVVAVEYLGESAPGQPTLGTCAYDTQQLMILERVVRTMSPWRTEQVLRHELAHAVVGPLQGHNVLWREIADLVGYADAWTHVPAAHEMEPRLMAVDEAYYDRLRRQARRPPSRRPGS